MRNVRRSNGTWIFRIPGVDLDDKIIIGAPALVTFVLFLAVLGTGSWMQNSVPGGLSGIETLLLLVLLPVAIILAGFFISYYLYVSGLWARYEVHLDFDTQTVTAYDRRNERLLWETPYDPNNLYMSQTRIHSRYPSRLQPALVYGDSRQDLVEFDVPSPRKTMLTTGSERHLNRLMRELSEDLP